jgi:hypothetical protein
MGQPSRTLGRTRLDRRSRYGESVGIEDLGVDCQGVSWPQAPRRTQSAHGAFIKIGAQLKGVCFSAEKADQATLADNGIGIFAMSAPSLSNLDDDLALGSAPLDVGHGLIRRAEWEDTINHRPDDARFDKARDLAQLTPVGLHEQE